MSTINEEQRDALAEALKGHLYDYPDSFCACGAHMGPPWNDHPKHQADALAPLIAGWLAEADADARLSEMQGKADSLTGRLIKAEAWREGHKAGRDYQGDGWNSDAHDPDEDNPYRAEASGQ